jgi:hypothetical protein
MKMVSKVLLTAATIAALAAPALAVDKLVVMDGITPKFTVQNTGDVKVGSGTIPAPNNASRLDILTAMSVTSPANSEPITAMYNNNILRYKLRADGAGDWYLNTGSGVEAGRIVYATPASKPGIVFYTNTNGSYNTDRMNLVNFGTYGHLTYHANYFYPSLVWTATNMVGIGTLTPNHKLEVNGGVRINPTTGGETKPACTNATAATDRGTLWFTSGSPDTLEVCAQDGAGTTAWRKLY